MISGATSVEADMKNKVKFEINSDPELCRKAAAVAAHEGLSFNNYIVKLMRSSVAYHERVHGKIPAGTNLPEDVFAEE